MQSNRDMTMCSVANSVVASKNDHVISGWKIYRLIQMIPLIYSLLPTLKISAPKSQAEVLRYLGPKIKFWSSDYPKKVLLPRKGWKYLGCQLTVSHDNPIETSDTASRVPLMILITLRQFKITRVTLRRDYPIGTGNTETLWPQVSQWYLSEIGSRRLGLTCNMSHSDPFVSMLLVKRVLNLSQD